MSFIETDRLILRTWMPDDVPRVARMYGDPEVMRYVGTGAAWSPAATAEAVAEMIDGYERDGIGIWPVVHKQSGAIVGDCGLQPLPGSDEIEISYTFDAAYWGHGYASEAASAVLQWGFARHGLARIIALCAPENARSIRLVARLGMRFERVVRARRADLLQYSMHR